MLLNVLRHIGYGISVFVFALAIQFAIFFVPVSLTVQGEDNVKSWLQDGKVYDRFAAVISSQLASEDRPDAEQGIKAEDLEKVINESLPPEVLEIYGNEIVGGIYAWLRGETPRPQFHVDLSERQAEIESSFRNLITEKLAGAPVCSPVPSPDDYNPIGDACLLPGYTSERTADEFVAKLFGGDGALSDLVLDSEKVFEGKDLKDHALPTVYDALNPIRLWLIVVVLVSGIGTVFLSKTWHKGLKRAGVVVLTTTIFATIGTFLFTWLIPNAVNRATLETGNEDLNITTLMVPILNAALSGIGRAVLLVTIPLSIAALTTLIWLARTNKDKESAEKGFKQSEHPSRD